MGVADELEKLHQLRVAGALTDDEFAAAKHKVLSDSEDSTVAPDAEYGAAEPGADAELGGGPFLGASGWLAPAVERAPSAPQLDNLAMLNKAAATYVDKEARERRTSTFAMGSITIIIVGIIIALVVTQLGHQSNDPDPTGPVVCVNPSQPVC